MAACCVIKRSRWLLRRRSDSGYSPTAVLGRFNHPNLEKQIAPCLGMTKVHGSKNILRLAKTMGGGWGWSY